MKTSFKAVRAALVAVFVFMAWFAADAQRVRLLQLERYLGQPIPNRAGYVGLTDTLGDQYYHKLDSIIGYIADSISQGLDTDEQYFDTAMIVNDTLILSIIRDGLPAHRISLTPYTSDDQTLSYDHATNTLSISGGNSVTNFEQAWLRSPDQLHPVTHNESVFRVGKVQLGYSGTPAWDEAQLRVYNESRIDWLTYTTSKPIFGQRFFEASELSNMLYLANKRFVYSFNGTPSTDSRLFNGEFETPLALATSSTTVVNVDFTEGLEKLTATGITYPEGYVYINFYYVYNNYDSIKVEVITTTQTHNISGTVKNIATRPDLGYKVLRYNVPSNNYVTDLKVTFYTNAGNCWPTEISYTQTRFAGELEEPFVNKHLDNKLHTKLTFRDKVGDRQGDNGTLGQIFMSKVDSVEWADFTAIPDLYEYVVNISDSVATIDDTDTDEQYFDSIAIVDDTLNISIIRDGVPLIRIDLKPYLDDTDTDDQYFDVINITDDTLNLSIFDDGLPTHRLDLKPYLDSEENTDVQYIDTLYFDMDTLYISLVRDDLPLQKVYLGDLISMADSDKQRHDTAFIQDNIIYLSLQRDSIPAHQLDLTPYLDDTDDQAVDQFDIVSDILSISLEDDGEAPHTVDLSPYLDNTDDQKIDVFSFVGTTLSVSNEDDGEASKTVDLSSLVDNWLLNGLDDAFGSTDIGDAETVTFDGTGGITAKLSFDGSNTMVIDGTGLQWILQAQSGTSQVIGDAASEIVEIVGAGNASTSISGNTVTITVPADVDNYVDALTFSNSTFILTAGRTGALADLTDTIMDHDWYKVGTALPPNNTEDARRDGLTGIGMDPVWLLDVAEDARIYGHQVGRGGGNLQVNLRVGINALSSNTTGERNIAIGPYALESNTTAHHNLAIGYEALRYNNNEWNTAVGQYSMQLCTDCFDNTAIGYQSMQGAINAQYNTAVGHDAIGGNKYGHGNTAVGDYAMKDDTLAYYNTAMGRFSMRWLSLTRGNTAVGYESLNITNNSGSEYNTVMGFQSMYGALNVSDNNHYNIAIGYQSLYEPVTTMSYNIGMGRKAAAFLDGNYNIAIGDSTLYSGSGDYNIVLGAFNTISADSNVIIGYNQSLSTNGNLLLTNGTGSQFIRMLNTGFVGLGVAAPTQKLHVPGNVRVTGAYYDSNNEPGTSGQVLSSTVTGTDWVTAGGTGTVTSVDIIQPASGITATGGPITTSGSITLALANDLAALEGLAGTGIAVRTAANTWANRSITSGGGINITNGDGVAGNIVLTVPAQAVNLNRGPSGGFYGVYPTSGTGVGIHGANGLTVAVYGGNSTDITVKTEGELLALDGFSATGMVAHTAANTWAARTITAGANVGVTNGDGISGNPTITTTSGYNGVGSGGTTSSTITTNTTGGNAITLNVAGTLSIAESPSSNGGSITITGTGGAGTVTSVGLTGTTGIGVTGSPITSSGTMTLSLNNDLAALEALSGTGIAVRTGAATWTNRTIVSGDANITITNGNGISGNPSITMQSHIYPQIINTDDIRISSQISANLPTYANDAAAGAGGLTATQFYKTATGELRIKL